MNRKLSTAMVLITFMVLELTFTNFGLVPRVRAQGQKEKTTLGTFPVPIKWDSQRLTLDSASKNSSQAFASGLTAKSENSTLANDVQTFLSERSLIPSNEIVKLTSERGELVGRLLTEVSTNNPSPSEEEVTRFLAYGQIDGQNYSFVYEFRHNK